MNTKIGISVGPKYGDEKYNMLKKHGFDCADFNILSDTDTPFYQLPEEEAVKLIKKEKALSEAAGIEINQVHGPWRWPAKDFKAEDRLERMDKMKRSIRLTSALDCKNWVIHPIMPFGVEEEGKPEAEQTWQFNIEFMSELLQEAKAYGITICLENMPMLDFSLSKPRDILRFVNDENFKICLDTGHVAVFETIQVGEAVRELGSNIKVLHVHDNKFQKDLHLPPFFGNIDWVDFVKALKEIKFDGVFSLETVNPQDFNVELYGEFEQFCAKIARSLWH